MRFNVSKAISKSEFDLRGTSGVSIMGCPEQVRSNLGKIAVGTKWFLRSHKSRIVEVTFLTGSRVIYKRMDGTTRECTPHGFVATFNLIEYKENK